MATNLDTVTLFAEAVEQFTDLILPMIQESERRLGHVDIPARSEAWSNFVDSLHSDEAIASLESIKSSDRFMKRSATGKLRIGSSPIVAMS